VRGERAGGEKTIFLRAVKAVIQSLVSSIRQMTFKTRPNSYSIGLAPTSAARCRRCHAIIQKGTVRIATHAFVRPQRSTTFFRCAPACVDQPFAAAILRRHKSAQRVPASADVPCDELRRIRRKLKELGTVDPVPRSSALRDTQPPTAPPAEQGVSLLKFFSTARGTPLHHP
jgi:hypothetical protein